jgi:hypothetical protein
MSVHFNSSYKFEDDIFQTWIFGDKKRQNMIHEGLLQVKRYNVELMIILTNGYADNVYKILKALGLEIHFYAIIDTRGTMIIKPYSRYPRFININNYHSKSEFVFKYVINKSSFFWGKISEKPFDILYIDDNPEIFRDKNIDVIRLPFEGNGMNKELFESVYEKLNLMTDSNKEKLVIWDFDCTLTQRHMYKSMFNVF